MEFHKIDLMELVDDVIDEGSPSPSPSPTKSQSLEEFSSRTNRTLERSCSYDPTHPQLRSILKRSKSDGASNTTDTDEDSPRRRVRSTTYTDQNHYSDENNEFSRRRNKSVSFMEKPMVREFTKMTKWQWKKQELKKAKKEKKKLKGNVSSDQTASSTDDEKTKPVSQDQKPEKVITEQPKSGRKWRKAQKKQQRNRTNSGSRSEEEPVADKTAEKKDKRKKNKKNKSGEISSQDEKTPTLNNPLIFQLD